MPWIFKTPVRGLTVVTDERRNNTTEYKRQASPEGDRGQGTFMVTTPSVLQWSFGDRIALVGFSGSSLADLWRIDCSTFDAPRRYYSCRHLA